MKRWMSLLLALILMATMASCGDKGPRETPTQAEIPMEGETVSLDTDIDASSTETDRFDMPKVVGLSESNAEKTLSSKGLSVGIQYAKSDRVTEGEVISQSIKAGTSVKKGAKVTLTVSSGKPTVSVANIVGKAKNAAVSTLEGQGFKVSVVESYDSNVASGKVISQSPSAGTNQMKGSTITLYVSKGKQPVSVTFNPNGGSVGTGGKTVYFTSTYGSLPTPNRNYYNFAGWYTAASGGNRVTDSTAVSDPNGHTLYAHWTEKGISGWVRASDVPADAKIVQQKWTYTKTETTTSTSSSMSGWTQTGSSWHKTGSETYYYASYPSGFNAGNSLYSKYNKSAMTGYTNTSAKREVSGSSVNSYIYWHWCRGKHFGSAVSNYNRKISESYSGEFWAFHAFESSTAISYNSAADAYWYVNANACDDTCWWNRVTVYKQTYTDYKKVYSYKKTTNLESTSRISASSTISNVQKWVKYQAR